jgi:hypothetical protein
MVRLFFLLICRLLPVQPPLMTTTQDLATRKFAKVCWLNVQTLADPRPDLVRGELTSRGVDFGLLGETWHAYRTDSRIVRCLPNGFRLKEQARGSLGGGLCTVLRRDYIATKSRLSVSIDEFEYLIVRARQPTLGISVKVMKKN